jgi:hypothetical protein
LDGGSAHRKAATYTQNKRTETSVPRVGLEPTTPVFERAKTVHDLERAATVFGVSSLTKNKLNTYVPGNETFAEITRKQY